MNNNQDLSEEALRFSEADVALFSLASHDVNPMHIKALYSRRTTFGQPVVFGMLGCLAAASNLPDRQGMILSGVSAMFHGPLFVGVEYQLEVQNKGRAQSKAIIRDAGRIIAAITYRFEPGEPGRAPSEEACPRLVPLDHRPEDLREGLEVKGDYAPKFAALAELLLRWGLSAKGLPQLQAAARPVGELRYRHGTAGGAGRLLALTHRVLSEPGGRRAHCVPGTGDCLQRQVQRRRGDRGEAVARRYDAGGRRALFARTR